MSETVTVKEAARRLGVSEHTVRSQIVVREIPRAHGTGRKILIPRRWLDAQLLTSREAT